MNESILVVILLVLSTGQATMFYMLYSFMQPKPNRIQSFFRERVSAMAEEEFSKKALKYAQLAKILVDATVESLQVLTEEEKTDGERDPDPDPL